MRTLLYWSVGILLALVVAYNIAFASYIYRYRLTVEVTANGRQYAGSSVQEAELRTQPRVLPEIGDLTSIRGQSPVIDLGTRGKLFMLMRMDEQRMIPRISGQPGTPTYEYLTRDVFGELYAPPGGADASFQRMSDLVGASRLLSGDRIPLMVRFRDLNDPVSIERVEPYDLEKSFGPGVQLKQVRVEIVDAGIWPLNRWGITGEPLTTGIKEVLPWLDEHYGKTLDGRRTHRFDAPNKLANSLTSGAFDTRRQR